MNYFFRKYVGGSMQAEAEGGGWQGGGDRNRIHTKFKVTDKYSLLSETTSY